ncbi:MAG: hypothetical protein R2704_17395 [Microthrixaceae bacterium]
MKTAVGTLKSDLQQFRELESFAAFGSDLDTVSKNQLERGYRLTELLKQGVGEPMPVEEQVVVLYAGTRGHLDGVATESVQRFAEELLEFFRARHGDLLEDIRSTGKLADEEALEAGIKRFSEEFDPGADGAHEPDAEAQADAASKVVDSDVTLPEEDMARDETTTEG